MDTEKKSSWIKHIDFSLLDLLCLEGAFLTAYVRYFNGFSWYEWSRYQTLALLLVIIQWVVDILVRNHQNILRREVYMELAESVKQVSLVMGSLLFVLFCMKDSALYSRVILITTWVFAVIYTFFVRTLWKIWLCKYYEKHKKLPHAVIITTSKEVDECLEELKNRGVLDVNIRGLLIFDKDMKGQIIDGTPVVANRDDICNYAMEHVLDTVFVNVEHHSRQLNKLLSRLVSMGITLHINISPFYSNYPNTRIEEFNGYSVVTSSTSTISLGGRFVKRTIDIVGALVGCVLTLAIGIFVAPILYIMDPGPIFFTQTRVGKNGRKFKIYKFRSMYVDAEARKKDLLDRNEMDGHMFKMSEDPRIIGSHYVMKDGKRVFKRGFGGFLRATSIDEMPQFFNVLKGDMSLIGTRPPTVEELEQYDYHHKVRLVMRPGITGLWQVSGRNQIVDFERVVKLDKRYIENWSIGLDFKILMKTIVVVFTNQGM